MPNGNLTLLDLAQRTGSDAVIGLIEDVTTYSPEFGLVLARPLPGTSYKLTRRVALPPSGFRHVNEGAVKGRSQYVQETKEMYFLDCHMEVDEAIVKGDPREIGDVLTDEAEGALQSSILNIGSQFYYGQAADAKGFVGLQEQLSADAVYAGGTNNTTSAYLVDISLKGVHFTVGRDGRIEMPDWKMQRVSDSGGSPYMAHITNLSSYIGLNVGSEHSVWRVRGIDASHGLTDVLGNKLLSGVPLMRRGNLRWFMNRTAAFTLQNSRSSIGQQIAGAAGFQAYAPAPTELAGIPITVTDSLLDTETTTAS